MSIKHPASLRDPAGYLLKYQDRLIRVIRHEYKTEYAALLSASWIQEECQKQNVASYHILCTPEALELVGPEAGNCLCIEHNVISFPSFPTEWPLEMLSAASELTLSLCQIALTHGFGLKDATPFNVLFKGSSPIFIDVLSFEKRLTGDHIWLAYGQFIRSFLLPVAIESYHTTPSHSIFFSHRDGIEPEEAYRLLSLFERLNPPFFSKVTMPVLLASKAEQQSSKVYAPTRLSNPDQATFILRSLFTRLLRTMQVASRRKHSRSVWTTYNDNCNYSQTDFSFKTVFIEQFLQNFKPERVLDIGCNTGHFSFLAARSGAEVVAIDLDAEVVGKLWQRAVTDKANILPLVINLARPTPALGWRNRETPSFLERAEGYFDAIFMLAVIHHLLVSDRIPLDEIIQQAAKLTTKWMVIEFVGYNDPQFKRLLRGREVLYTYFKKDLFENELAKHFEIIRHEEIADTGRWLYITKRKYAH
jgi:SAM-dependent methyltransferase